MPPLWSPLIWLLVAGALLIVELVQPSFDGLMFAVLGGLVVSVLTALLPLQVWIQITVFSLITLLGTFWLSRWSAQRNPRPGRRRLKDDTAEVLAAVLLPSSVVLSLCSSASVFSFIMHLSIASKASNSFTSADLSITYLISSRALVLIQDFVSEMRLSSTAASIKL